jgi:hypothetical protein
MLITLDSELSFKSNSHGTAFHAKKVFKFVTKLLKIISATKAFLAVPRLLVENHLADRHFVDTSLK